MKNNDNKTIYRQFCEDHHRKNTENTPLSIFAQAWFLDAVCGQDNWGVCVDIGQNGRINGVLPYFFTKKWGVSIIQQPVLTGYIGLWIHHEPHWNAHQKASQERGVLKNLIAQLPKVAFLSQAYPPYFQNWLPFYWAGFEQSARMTHILRGLKNPEMLIKNFKDNVRKKIKKASTSITTETTDDVDLVYALYNEIMATKGRKMSYSQSFLRHLHAQIKENKAGELYKAVDRKGAIHAAVYIVWDKTSAYYWLGGSAIAHRNSGALTLLLWEIMQDVGKRGIDNFDFTGSDLENLESFFAAFNPEKQTYFKVTRYGHPVLKRLDKIFRG
ncbi:MAG: GNAT family N-acetyltransferase [Saprospiraceae bacterium]|nr:GNAT family N-acetyltransferase [Saprospiraceae bacterium]